MKIRLEGTKDEIKWAIHSLNKVYSVSSESRLYQNRDKVTYRCYLEVTAFFIRSGSEADLSSIERDDSVANPMPWDVVLGGSDEH
jgi:hypothetical protein